MTSSAELNFVRQQGFLSAPADVATCQYPSLMWQPRVVGILVLAGILFQSALLFAILGAVLVWGVVLPRRNVFDALYNRLVAGPRDRPRLDPAPAPRRFAQGLAATFLLGAAISLTMGWAVAAWTLQAFVVVALAALILGRFCLGSYVFLLLTHRGDLARRTLPWARAH